VTHLIDTSVGHKDASQEMVQKCVDDVVAPGAISTTRLVVSWSSASVQRTLMIFVICKQIWPCFSPLSPRPFTLAWGTTVSAVVPGLCQSSGLTGDPHRNELARA